VLVHSFPSVSFFFFCGTGAWTQGLHLEPLHQPYFCEGFLWDKVLQTICLGWLWTAILLISASRVARITDMSHRWLAVSFWHAFYIYIYTPHYIWSWDYFNYHSFQNQYFQVLFKNACLLLCTSNVCFYSSKGMKSILNACLLWSIIFLVV
jgi:hypothetical protein